MSHVSFVYLFCFVELNRFKYYAYAEKNFNFDLCAFSVNDNNTEYLYIYVLYTQICIVRIRTHCTYFIHMREKLFFCKIHISITGNIFHILFKTDILKKYWQYTDTHIIIYTYIFAYIYTKYIKLTINMQQRKKITPRDRKSFVPYTEKLLSNSMTNLNLY